MKRIAFRIVNLIGCLVPIVLVANTIAGELPEQVRVIDQMVERQWHDQKLRPAKPADDGVWCRRLYLDLIGRTPTLAELEEFSRFPRRLRKVMLVDRLMDDPAYRTERVEVQVTRWTNLLLGRTGGTANNSLASRKGLANYLETAFRENRSYRQIVDDIVTAEGANEPDAEDFNGAVNYLLAKLEGGNTQQATAHVARVFLGRQVECTQCHNHPFNEWKQSQFWELDSFLRQAVALRRFDGGGQIRFVELADQDFRGEGSTPREAEIYYERRNGELRSAYPRFLDGTAINASGLVGEVHRRRELARLILSSHDFAPALVNRVWSEFLGFGFTKPVDDMGPHTPVSHPRLLAYLATEFRETDYDLKELTRWIVLSRPYQLSSDTTPRLVAQDDPLAQPSAWFSRFYLRQISPEALYASLLTVINGTARRDITLARSSTAETSATQEATDRMMRRSPDARRARWLRQFARASGNDDGAETTSFDGTIPQALMMFHGELTEEALRSNRSSLVGQLLTSNLDPRQKMEKLFLAGLARRPTTPELRALRPPTNYTADQMETWLQDLWWAILNSNEFILQH